MPRIDGLPFYKNGLAEWIPLAVAMSGDPSNSPMSSTHRPGPAIRSVLNKKVVRSLQHRTHSCALRRSESMPPLRLHRRIPLLLRAKHLLLGAAHLRSQERRGIQPLTILSRRRAPRTGVGAAVFRNTFGATLSSRGRRVESRVQIVGSQPAEFGVLLDRCVGRPSLLLRLFPQQPFTD